MRDHPKIQRGADHTLWLGFGQYGKRVDVAAISGDGRRVLTVRAVGVAEVFDTDSQALVGRITPESPLTGSASASPFASEFVVFIESAALSGDGSLALLGLNDGTAGVFRVADGARLALLHPPDEVPAQKWQVIRAVAYAGPHALVGFNGRRVGVWSEDGARCVAWLESPAGARVVGRPWVRQTLVSRVAGSLDGRWIFAGASDMTASLWDLRSGTLVFEAIEQAEEMIAVFDGAAGCGWATSAGALWCARSGEPPRKLLATGEPWAEVVVRGDQLLARDTQGGVTRWSFADVCRFTTGSRPESTTGSRPESTTGSRPESLHPGPEPGNWSNCARSLGFGEDDAVFFPEGGRRLAVIRGDRRRVLAREAQIVEARFSPAGDAVAVYGWLDQVELWSVADGALVRTFPQPGGVCSFSFSRDGAMLAIGAIGHGGGRYPRSVLVYDTATGALLQELHGHDWQVSRVAFSPSGGRIASIGDDLLVFERKTGRVVLRAEVDRVTADLHYFADGRLLVIDTARARLYSGGRRLRSHELPVGYQTPWCVGHDPRFITVGLPQGLFRLDLETGAHELWSAPIIRSEGFPPAVLCQHGIRVGCAVWRTPHGLFLHQSDGPRGWIEPLTPFGGRVAVPTVDGAVVVDLSSTPVVVGQMPFNGALRASAIVRGEVLLVNDEGRLFRAPEPRS